MMSNIKKYTLEGMTCSSCKRTIEQTLNALPEVQSVKVDFTKKVVELSLNQSITRFALQKSLPEKYTLQEFEPASHDAQTESGKSKLKQLAPLLWIFFYLLVASSWMQWPDGSLREGMLDFMGLFFIVFSFFKLLDIRGFAVSFQRYDPLAKRWGFYGLVYPFIEVVLGLLFLNRVSLTTALGVTLLILGITTWGVARILLDKQHIQCACLGTVLNLPMTEATLIENGIMLIMAIFMLTAG